MSMPNRTAGLIIIGSATWFWAVFLAMHILEPEFDPIRAPGSAYVLGPYGTWMTSTYFALSAVLLSARLGLGMNLSGSPAAQAARVLFLVAGFGAILAGLFPMDYPGPPRSLSGRLHVVGGALTFPAWVLGTYLFSLRIRRDHRWARRAGLLVALSVMSIGMFAVLVLSVTFLGFGGYAQRLLMGLLFVWMIVVAVHLIRFVPERGGAQPNKPLQPASGTGTS
jgi:uncharacterized protein DUF998